ncbi:hypothetical protein [Kitasatospora sp. NPDC093102]|uniref:hypothetical protein n=1 Tax=Kitasatospora sp. NPDC093102 TaxID=3155069 RepID=UPI00341506BA
MISPPFEAVDCQPILFATRSLGDLAELLHALPDDFDKETRACPGPPPPQPQRGFVATPAPAAPEPAVPRHRPAA